jgi:tetratricopeptide (TPR) repeat protein
MKIVLLVFIFSFFCSLSQAQVLKNTIWVQVKSERKDGSRIVDYQNTEDRVIKYDFRESEVMISNGNLFMGKMAYVIHDKTLEIGKFVKFTIDTVNEKKLILIQISNEDLDDDKINKLTFINRNYIFSYLKERNLLTVIQDSLIEYNDKASPAYYSATELFGDKLSMSKEERKLSGTFIITADGKIENVIIEKENGFSKKDTAFVKHTIESTSGSWMMPYTPAYFRYKMNFLLETKYYKPIMTVSLSFVDLYNKPRARLKSPGIRELIEAGKYYKEGLDFVDTEKYGDAINSFLQCLKIDSLYIDAYYNLAYCYGKIDQKEKACEALKKLKDLGQKTGSDLYDSTCK